MKTTLHTDWTVCYVGNGFVSDRNEAKDYGLIDKVLQLDAFNPLAAKRTNEIIYL